MSEQIKNSTSGQKITSIVFLLMTCFAACDFEPDEIYFKEVTPGDQQSLTINLEQLSSTDTVFVFDLTTFQFANDAGRGHARDTRIFVDGQLKQAVNAAIGEFIIDAKNYPDGIHSMSLEFTGTSATGSLADHRGNEELNLVRKWVMIVDKTPPSVTPIISVEVVDGMAEIKWAHYSKWNFQNYILEKERYEPTNNSYGGCRTFIIEEKSKVSFRDSSYIGGLVRYSLKIRSGTKESEKSYKTFDVHYLPQLEQEPISPDEIRLTWRKPQLYKAFSQYGIMANGYSINEYLEKKDRNDTTVILKLHTPYGTRNGVALYVMPKIYDFCNGSVVDTTSISLGTIFSSFNRNSIVYNKPLDAYFAIKLDNQSMSSLVRINALTGEAEKTYFIRDDGDFTISENGKYLYVAYHGVLKQLDPITFSVIRTFNLFDLTQNYTRPWGKFSVSNTNVLSLVLNWGSYVLAPDFSLLSHSSGYSTIISKDGNYLFSNGKLLQWNGTSFVEKYSIDHIALQFINEEKLLFVTKSGNEIGVLNLSSGVVERTIPYEGNEIGYFAYDPQSNLIYGFKSVYPTESPGIFYLYNTSLDLVGSFEIANPDISRGHITMLLNNNLICSDGYYLPLSVYYPR